MTTPPGSTGLPIVGEALKFLADPFTFQLERTRKHGPIWKTKILADTVVFFVGPRAFSFFLDPDNFTREKGCKSRRGGSGAALDGVRRQRVITPRRRVPGIRVSRASHFSLEQDDWAGSIGPVQRGQTSRSSRNTRRNSSDQDRREGACGRAIHYLASICPHCRAPNDHYPA